MHPNVIQALRDEARALATQGDISGAVAKFEQALALDSTLGIEPEAEAKGIYASVFVDEGRTLAQAGDVEAATAKFEQAVAFDPTVHIEPEVEAKRIYASVLVQAGRSLAQSGDIEGAIAEFEQALAFDPSLDIKPETEASRLYAPVLVQEGRLLAQSGDVEGAIAKFEQALAFDPSLDIKPEAEASRLYAPVLVEEGRTLARGGEIEGAVAKFQQALTLDPKLDIDPQAEANRLAAPRLVDQGRLMARGGDVVGAVARFEQALTFDPNLSLNPQAEAQRFLALGMVDQGKEIARRGDRREATAKFAEALRLAPDLGISPELMAQVEYAVGLLAKPEYLGTMTALSEAQTISPTYPITGVLRAEHWYAICREGSLAGAPSTMLPACERAMANGAPNYRDGRGLARALTGDTEGAMKDFQAFVDRAMDNGQPDQMVLQRKGWLAALALGANPVRGYMLARSGEISEAVAIYSATLAVSPTLPLAADDWNNLCWHGSRRGQADAVMFACNKAIELAPDNGNYHDSRGVARALVGDISGAHDDLQFFVDWAAQNGRDPTSLAQRQIWLRALNAGFNPVRAYFLAQTGHVAEALALYDAMLTAMPDLTLTADEWNTLCWYGSRAGRAAQVLPACEKAVSMVPDNGNYHDSRGLARVLTGDIAGAIADYESAVQWAERVNEWQEFITSRRTFIAVLKVAQQLQHISIKEPTP